MSFQAGKNPETISNELLKRNLIINKSIFYPFEEKSPADGFIFNLNRVELAPGSKLPKGFTTVKEVDPASLTNVKHTKKEECGQSWNLPQSAQTVKSSEVITVLPGQDNILTALYKAKPGDIIELTDGGDYPVSEDIFIDKKII